MRYVLDSSSLIAFFDNEEGSLFLSDLMVLPNGELSVTMPNLCEVLYHFERTTGKRMADRVLIYVMRLGITLIEEFEPKVWREAAHLKAEYKRLSLADAFGVAYAKKIRGVFVTSDHKELEPLDEAGEGRFLFFR